MEISFHSVSTSFSLRERRQIRGWLLRCAAHYDREIGELSFVFCSDEYLLEMNRKHLNHDYYTDIITFDYSADKTISGDLFISIDRVRDNAKSNHQLIKDELHRVMVHGVLHLIGFGDKSDEQAHTMRAQEDYCLTLR